ncbi:Alginate production protein AlgE [Thalassocella blandensis]|nr:Alginate production protein AlgE [Thalassocella blandensis]
MNLYKNISASCLSALLVCGANVQAAEHDMSYYINLFDIYEKEVDDQNTIGINLEPRLSSQYGENFESFISLQAFYATDVIELESDDNGGSSDAFVGVKQAWVAYKGLSDHAGDVLLFGRARLRFDDGLMLDKDVTTVNWQLHTTQLEAQLGIASRLDTFRSDDSELSPTIKEAVYGVAQVRWQHHFNHYVSANLVYGEQDESGFEYDVLWSEFALENGYHDLNDPQRWTYNVGVLFASGTQGENSDVNGSAIDLGLRWQPNAGPVFMGLAYTAALEAEEGYIQTGLQSNRSNFSGSRHRLYRFNEYARFELQNLEAATAMLGVTPNQNTEVAFIFNHFTRVDADYAIVSAGMEIEGYNDSNEIGQGIDMVASYYFEKGDPALISNTRIDSFIRLRVSAFKAGEALNVAEENNFRATLDWVMRI